MWLDAPRRATMPISEKIAVDSSNRLSKPSGIWEIHETRHPRSRFVEVLRMIRRPATTARRGQNNRFQSMVRWSS
jgi:hypothetical protein